MRSVLERLATFGELVVDALREIAVHPLRSLLTLSGIVFGAASLVAMVSLSGALQEMATTDMRSFGMPRSFSVRNMAPPPDARGASALRETGLRLRDLELLRQLPSVEMVHGASGSTNRMIIGPVGRLNLPVQGVDAGYLELRNMPVRQGRSFAPLDIAHHARVAVVGGETVRELFGNVPPVGQVITLNAVRFLVIGVVDPMPVTFIPADFTFLSRRIYIPYSYVTRYERASGRVDAAFVTTRTDADVGPALASGTRLLEQRHGARDFDIENDAAEYLSDIAMADDILGGWNVVMLAIGGITLLVGGIGLFSVLLISVRERVREIGVRKALGADDRDILQLFLAESLTLAALGALLGVGGGTGLVLLTEFIAGQFGRTFDIAINPYAVVVAVLFALLAGLVFGWYPARRASRLDPIEAISEV
jgi:putative ABC transport system permease protein